MLNTVNTILPIEMDEDAIGDLNERGERVVNIPLKPESMLKW